MKYLSKISSIFPKSHQRVISLSWTGSGILLAVLFIVALLFDGYVFLYKVYTIGREYIPVNIAQQVSNVNQADIDEVSAILFERKEKHAAARENLPSRRPFQ